MKIIKIVIIVFIIVSCIVLYVSKSQVQIAFNTVIELDRARNRVIAERTETNYDSLVDNNKLKEYYEIRDKYNILWVEKNNSKYELSSLEYGPLHGIVLFKRCYLYMTTKSIVNDNAEPVKKYPVKNARFIMLKKKNGKWYAIKDIQVEKNKAWVFDIFNSNYIDNCIMKYKEYNEKML